LIFSIALIITTFLLIVIFLILLKTNYTLEYCKKLTTECFLINCPHFNAAKRLPGNGTDKPTDVSWKRF